MGGIKFNKITVLSLFNVILLSYTALGKILATVRFMNALLLRGVFINYKRRNVNAIR